MQNLFVLLTQCIYVFYMNLRTDRDYIPLQHKMIGFYNQGRMCLQRGANRTFKYNSG